MGFDGIHAPALADPCARATRENLSTQTVTTLPAEGTLVLEVPVLARTQRFLSEERGFLSSNILTVVFFPSSP